MENFHWNCKLSSGAVLRTSDVVVNKGMNSRLKANYYFVLVSILCLYLFVVHYVCIFLQVGLAVDHNWFENMTTKYQALLDRMAESDMPETAAYRQAVEKIARYRIKACMDYPDDPDMVEELCNCGQVEELIQQADKEMSCLEMYLRTRMWEIVEEYNKDHEFIIEDDTDPMDDDEGIDWIKEEAFGQKYTRMKEEAELRYKKRH